MKKQLFGLALLLFAIIVAMLPGSWSQIAWIISIFLGLGGLIIVIINSGDDEKE